MLQAPTDPIAAVSHADPYPYPYPDPLAPTRRCVPSRGCSFADHKLWALVTAPLVTAAFNMAQAKVRPPGRSIPAFLEGTRAGDVFGRLARMADGPPHAKARDRTMRLMRKLTGELVAAGSAQ